MATIFNWLNNHIMVLSFDRCVCGGYVRDENSFYGTVAIGWSSFTWKSLVLFIFLTYTWRRVKCTAWSKECPAMIIQSFSGTFPTYFYLRWEDVMWLLCSAAPWIVYDVLVIGYIYLYANGNIKKKSAFGGQCLYWKI